MNLQQIIGEVITERQYQDNKHGGPANDDRNTFSDWENWITEHLSYALADVHAGTRQEFIRVAALAVAAVEAFDRNGGIPS